MKTFKKVAKIAMYVLLAWIALMQVLAIVGVAISHVNALKETPWLIPVWCVACALLVGAVVLCHLFKNKEKWPLLPMMLGLWGALLATLVALTLQGALPEQVAATTVSLSGIQGLNPWKLFWRHYSLAIVGVVTAVVSFLNHKRVRDQRIRKENDAYTEHFDFSNLDPLFSDPTDTVDRNKKLSKKQRKALREKENNRT